MRPLKYLPHYTIEDYRQWEGNWELIDGLPYAMSPSPKRKHQKLGTILTTYISNSLQRSGAQCKDCDVVYELDWIIDDTNVVCPDIAVICNETGDFITKPPVLIIEILSPATALKDRQVKFDIYQQQGVKYYLLLDPEAQTQTIFVLVNGQYEEQKDISSYTIHDNCAITLDIGNAFSQLS